MVSEWSCRIAKNRESPGLLASTSRYDKVNPEKFMTPDTVETRIGTLEFFDGLMGSSSLFLTGNTDTVHVSAIQDLEEGVIIVGIIVMTMAKILSDAIPDSRSCALSRVASLSISPEVVY